MLQHLKASEQGVVRIEMDEQLYYCFYQLQVMHWVHEMVAFRQDMNMIQKNPFQTMTFHIDSKDVNGSRSPRRGAVCTIIARQFI